MDHTTARFCQNALSLREATLLGLTHTPEIGAFLPSLSIFPKIPQEKKAKVEGTLIMSHDQKLRKSEDIERILFCG